MYKTTTDTPINLESNPINLESNPNVPSWHFDPSTERNVVQSDKKYQLLNATANDTKKVIGFYQHHPVPGYEIQTVEVIYNRNFNQKFHLHIDSLQERANSPVFAPKWPSMLSPELREKTIKSFEQLTQPYTDNAYPNVKLFPGWHGTNAAAIDSIFKTGYSNLAFIDEGFFGKGLYSAHEAEYSYRVYCKGALILNWVACFSPLPVVGEDMKSLKGKGNYGNYDAHFVPVVPKNPNNPNEVSYYPCQLGQTPVYNELVVFEGAACLPRFLVTLQKTLLKPLPQAQQPTHASGLTFFEHSEVALLSLAKKATDEQQYYQALGHLNSLVNKTPHHPEYRFLRACCFIKLSLRKDALNDLDIAIQYRAKHGQSYVERAHLYEFSNKMQDALADYNQAIKLEPKHAFAYCRRGVVHAALGNMALAAEDFAQSLKLNPVPNTYLARASFLMPLKRYTEAIADLEKVVQQRPNWNDAKAMLKEAQRLQDRPETEQKNENCCTM